MCLVCVKKNGNKNYYYFSINQLTICFIIFYALKINFMILKKLA